MSRLTTERLWALVLIWALLLCHGAFGTLHLIPDPAFQPTMAGEHATMQHPSHTHGTAASHEHPASHHTDYFAVLLGTSLGGLVLWLLLQNGWRDGTSSARRFASSPPATFSNLPRGPTLSFLQMLRL